MTVTDIAVPARAADAAITIRPARRPSHWDLPTRLFASAAASYLIALVAFGSTTPWTAALPAGVAAAALTAGIAATVAAARRPAEGDPS